MLSVSELLLQFPFPALFPVRGAKARAAALGKLIFWSSRECPHHKWDIGSGNYVTPRYTKSSNCYFCINRASVKKSKAQHALRSRRATELAKAANPELARAYFQSPRLARKYDHEFYFTGRACPAGHVTLRYANNSRCMACAGRFTLPPLPPPIE